MEASIQHPSQMLPRDTLFLMSLDEPSVLVEAFGSGGAFEGTPFAADDFRDAQIESLGFDVSSAEAWKDKGLALHAPVGLSLGPLPHAPAATFVSLEDRTRALAFVRQRAKERGYAVAETEHEGALALTIDSSPPTTVIVRGELMAIVTGTSDASFIPKLISTKPEESLASTHQYTDAMKGLEPAEINLWVDPKPFVDMYEPVLSHSFESAAAELITVALTQGIGGMGVGASLLGTEPRFEVRLEADETSTFRRLLAERSEPSTLASTMDGSMLWCMAGQVDPTVAARVVPPLMAEWVDYVSRDSRTLLRESWAGGWEFCATVNRELDASQGLASIERSLDFGIVMAAKDAAHAEKLVGVVEDMDGLSEDPAGGMVLDDGLQSLPVHIDTVGSRVVFSTDAKLAERIRGEASGSMLRGLGDSSVAAKLTGTEGAMIASYGAEVGMQWIAAMGRASRTDPMFDMISEEESPLSDQSKAKRAELEKAHAEFMKLHPKRGENMLEKLVPVAATVGPLGFVLSEDDNGFTLRAAPSMGPKGVQRMLEAMKLAGPGLSESLDPAVEAEIAEAEARFQTARQEFIMARIGDQMNDMPMLRAVAETKK